MVDQTPPRIIQLDESVINRIAAGEIIIHPANALKELLENAIDAKSTMIDVLVKDGGLKLLQITDNGSGIDREDLGLLCERFATSKLSTFEDLSSIATYGFRGEALASISHIARLSVVTKTKDSSVAYKAYYSNGKLADSNFKISAGEASPKPIAGKNGTTITVEDLFYNAPARLKATKSKNDEFIKILDVIGRYAVHSEVGISCKKFGDSHQALITRPNLTLKERIRIVFGSSVANEIIDFKMEISEEARDLGLYDCFGAITTSNYVNKKKIQPVLFINGRLVQCDPLKRSIMSIYAYFLPKGNQPFVYVSLQINPQNVDVNVHPTKKEVRFLNEDEIIDIVSAKVHSLLSKIDTSRTFKTQSVLTREKRSTTGVSIGAETLAIEDIEKAPLKKYRQENKLVRTDAKQFKLHSFMNKNTSNNDTTDSNERVDVQLSSIVQLRQELVNSNHKGLTEIFNGSTYVGIIDEMRRLCSFQFGVKLFICDYAATLNEFYYQLALSEFCNYGEFIISESISVREILQNLYTSDCSPSVDLEDVVERIFAMKDMYEEYFKIKFDQDNNLISLPMILKNIEPVVHKLPYFFYRLGANINYEDERECLQGIMKEIALLYIPEPIANEPGSTDEEKALNDAKRDVLDQELENRVFPSLQQKFIATSDLLEDVMEIADLPGLYKVFERC
ncbi:DNA mismatch repair protein Mlh1p [[Candida] railenensis]|uniref:DNA mismatch repair protein Mlh1p n=1 Tax=[Candida] railenensis TaxID=45579 RepID=A0A9P0W0N4_9ASCO|nr:DNA mismatch repair protein Mlh1p [[Candida] railenensis]